VRLARGGHRFPTARRRANEDAERARGFEDKYMTGIGDGFAGAMRSCVKAASNGFEAVLTISAEGLIGQVDFAAAQRVRS
jgi:hypothetical protein